MKRPSIIILNLIVMFLPILARAETAVYNFTCKAPRCASGVSPCNVPSSLIHGRGSMSGGLK